MKIFYLLCAIAGAVIPYSQVVPWFSAHGLELRLFAAELFSTRIGAFFGLDVIVSAVVLIAFIVFEGKRAQVRNLWAPIAATCLIGVSCGLPLFLYMREARPGAKG
jgi:Terpene cyclase DEP1